MSEKFKIQMYKQLLVHKPNILAEARNAADEIGIPKELKGRFGLLRGGSGCPGPIPFKEVTEAMHDVLGKVQPLSELVDELRYLVKDVYGDGYDAAPISTGEAALWVMHDVLVTPPMEGRGDNYLATYIAPHERHMHHQASYGRPFPGRFKDMFADRGVTAGEFGLYGKRLSNTKTVWVNLPGAKYDCHGIKYHPCCLLTGVDPERSAEKIAEVAERHASTLTGFTSLAYDTPGYGYGKKDGDGAPRLQKLIGKLAGEYDVPYLTDNARGLPFLGTDLRKINSDAIMYSGDKAIPGPTSGLIIGKEDAMVQIRRSLGMHGNRWGTTSSYGKSTYAICDPGESAIAGLIAALRIIRDKREMLMTPLDDAYQIVRKEFSEIDPRIKEGILITKSDNSWGIEVNYEQTWKDGEFGIPIFPIEDHYAGSCLLMAAMAEMGVRAGLAYDANIPLNPGMACLDEEGKLLEERWRKAIKALVRSMEIISKYAGLLT